MYIDGITSTKMAADSDLHHKHSRKSASFLIEKTNPLKDSQKWSTRAIASRSERKAVEELRGYLQQCMMIDYFVLHGNPEKELDLKLSKQPYRKRFFTSPGQWRTLSLHLCGSTNWSMNLRRVFTGKRRAEAYYNAKLVKHIDRPAAALGLDIQTVRKRVGYVAKCACSKTKSCRSMPHGLARMAKWHSLKEKVLGESAAALEAIFGEQTARHKLTGEEVVLKDFVYELIERIQKEWFEDRRCEGGRCGSGDHASDHCYKALTSKALDRCMDVPIFAMCCVLGEKEDDPYGYDEAKMDEKGLALHRVLKP